MGNIGSEIGRAIFRRKENKESSQRFFEMGLELFDATILDPKNENKKEELLRICQELADYFSGDIFSELADKKWNDYFYTFAWATAIEREK